MAQSNEQGDGELRKKLMKLAEPMGSWQGYYNEAMRAIPEDTRQFVDSTSWAGEIHKAKRIELFVDDLVELFEAYRKQHELEAKIKGLEDAQTIVDWSSDAYEQIGERIAELKKELEAL